MQIADCESQISAAQPYGFPCSPFFNLHFTFCTLHFPSDA